jgi:hypothetical protein
MTRLPTVAAVLAAGLALWAWQAHSGSAPGAGRTAAAGGTGTAATPPLEFPTADPAAWINSPPLTLAGLRGKVVLLDIFTYG